jgi:hypothetical protein
MSDFVQKRGSLRLLSEVSLTLGYCSQGPLSSFGKVISEIELDPTPNKAKMPPVQKATASKEIISKGLLSLPNSPLFPPGKETNIAINDKKTKHFKSIGNGV